VANAVIGAIVTAAVSTVGDYLWANVLPHHRPIYGFAHGAILFLTVGFCLGIDAGKPILHAICYCTSCRTAGLAFAQAPGAPSVVDGDGGCGRCCPSDVDD